ncbi:MAG: glycoside hydrolase family 57 protein [bacterium]|jgi:alpha-amylase/alpha-mannosidase (GH57 family)
MSHTPLRVAFLWHMHQPHYKDPRTGIYRLPWVRLHALKDYHDMAARLDDFPGIKANFNLVPCLVEQILDYASGSALDSHLELSRKRVGSLSEAEKVAFLRNSFMGNRGTVIERHPRYRALYEKCGPLGSELEARAALRRFSEQDLLDLQVWSNLAWFDPAFRREPLVADLLARGRGFTEKMKAELIESEFKIIRSIIPKYRELLSAGRIEITFSPYYHPILPLLCDPESARDAVPGIALPPRPMRFPEDAARQVELGRAYQEEVFGLAPEGMWPPEGALSEECLRVACEAGVRWVAADETTLAASLGVKLRETPAAGTGMPEVLYSPHRYASGGREAVLVFRDRLLSDLISFSYMRKRAEDAVNDFVGRLESIRKELGSGTRRALVLIALDGENCWEYYDQDGDVFLRTLYRKLSETGSIETVRISEALRDMGELPTVDRVATGSWIGGNLATWIGGEEANRAWELLRDARETLEDARRGGGLEGDALEAARRNIYAAEGSDWFWWWGRESGCMEESEFDALFRTHLMQVYRATGARSPASILKPVADACAPGRAISKEPVAFMKPVLDGRVTTFYEWKLAGLYEAYKDVYAHGKDTVISAIYFGFDEGHLFLRLDTNISPAAPEFADLTFRIEFIAPRRVSVHFRAPGPRTADEIDLSVEAGVPAAGARGAALQVTELAIPFSNVSAPASSTISLRVAVWRGDKEIERRPTCRAISLNVPGPDFEAEMWSAL